MISRHYETEFLEPERYELHEPAPYRFHVSRRDFIRVLGAGILISVAAPGALAQRRRGRGGASASERLHLSEDGTITVLTGKVEVGQGSRTQITQAAAEELGVTVDQLRLIMADSDLVPDDGGTAGSRTTPSTVPSVRKGCAVARQLLLETAASKFGADAGKLSVRDGAVQGLPGGASFSYALWARESRDNPLPSDSDASVDLTAVSEWKVLGTSTDKVGAEDIVTGKHQYPSDIRRPGMLYGAVLRSPTYRGRLESIDLSPARKMEGVVAVRDGDFAGFAAPTSFEAMQARDAAGETARWNEGELPSSDELEQHLRREASDRPRGGKDGSPDEVIASAGKSHRATYFVPYIQHTPMEPRAAVAEWNGGRLTVWTGTQQPSRVQRQLAEAFGIDSDQVRLIVPDTGGGFGGKHSGETAVEAARLAKEAGKPVSLRWSREEEFTWAYFRPAGVLDMEGALDEKGDLVAWKHANYNSGSSALETPYDIRNKETVYYSCDQPLRSGSYRALASTANVFARECFMDELAEMAGVNPLEFRLRYLSNDRLRAVLAAVAEKFDWNSKWKRNAGPQREGFGVACGTEKGSYLAACARVEVNENEKTYKVAEVYQAFECGAIQNPFNLEAQINGCMIQGLGAVLREEIRFDTKQVLNPRFSEYATPRMVDVPKIVNVLVNRPDLPSVGAGETPIVGVAPAVGNAIYNATGIRLRRLPLWNDQLRPT